MGREARSNLSERWTRKQLLAPPYCVRLLKILLGAYDEPPTSQICSRSRSTSRIGLAQSLL
jgi:hypothetical protein